MTQESTTTTAAPPVGDLASAVQNVEAKRRAAAEIAARVKEAKDEFTRTHAVLLQSLVTAVDEVETAERATKALATAHFVQSGKTDKHPTPGVDIKESETLEYDAAEALKFAKEKGLFLIPESLDEKAFEAFAKTAPVGTLPFVKRVPGYFATLAKDLTKALSAVTAKAGA